jgi:hypothetical protein
MNKATDHDERVDSVVNEALLAFWARVAELLPEATSGDMAPGDDEELNEGAAVAVDRWIMWNYPGDES